MILLLSCLFIIVATLTLAVVWFFEHEDFTFEDEDENNG